MVALLFSLVFAKATIFAPAQTPKAFMIRYGGRDSYSIKEDVLRKGFARSPYDPPNPQYLDDGSIGFTSNPEVFAVFDQSYRPWRCLLAKRQLTELLMSNDPTQAYQISQLPQALKDEITLHLELTIPNYVMNEKTCITFMSKLATKIHLKNSTIDFEQGTNMVENPGALDMLKQNPTFYSEEHAAYIAAREQQYAKIPLINVFGPIEDGPVNFEKRQKIALRTFEDWSQMENFRIDLRFFEYLERANVWTDKAALFRCKLMSDLASISPSVYQSMMNALTKNYESSGFTNEDAMREALASAQTFSTTSFECRIGRTKGGLFQDTWVFRFP